MPVHYEMSAYEKVGYFVPIVLNDLKEDVYEDLELKHSINPFKFKYLF